MLHDVDSAFAAQGHRPMLPPLVCHMPMHPRCRRREDLDDGLEVCQLNCTLDDDVHEDLSQASLHHLLLHECVSFSRSEQEGSTSEMGSVG